jgi:hypothetical protein
MIYGNTSATRYTRRQMIWKERHRVLPLTRHHAWWLLHNMVSHPILGVWPSKRAIWFHDYTSQHLNLRRRFLASPTPEISNRRAWVFHNVLGHLAIGLFPIGAMFRFHDKTAEAMGVPDWL